MHPSTPRLWKPAVTAVQRARSVEDLALPTIEAGHVAAAGAAPGNLTKKRAETLSRIPALASDIAQTRAYFSEAVRDVATPSEAWLY